MGRAVAGQLAGKGAHVVVVARTAAKLEATVEELKVCGTSISSTGNNLTSHAVQGPELAQAAVPLYLCRPH